MTIIEAIKKARETQQPSSEGYNAIHRGNQVVDECDLTLIPRENGYSLLQLFSDEWGYAQFAAEDLIAEDWTVSDIVPETGVL